MAAQKRELEPWPCVLNILIFEGIFEVEETDLGSTICPRH